MQGQCGVLFGGQGLVEVHTYVLSTHARESASTVKLMVRSLPSSYWNTTGDGHQRRKTTARSCENCLKTVLMVSDF